MKAFHLKNINFHYNSKSISGIHNFTATFKPSTLNILLGPSGSGKSTLLKIINQDIKPDSGEISKEHKVLSYQSVKEKFSKQPDMTVLELLCLFDKSDDIARARDFLYDFNITHTHKSKLSTLSHGELQRTLLASCFLQEPQVIILDEVFHGIDETNRAEIIDLLKEVSKKRETILILASQLLHDALTFADQILLINHGSISDFGKPQDLYFRPKNLFCASFWGKNNCFVHSKNDQFEAFKNISIMAENHKEKLLILRPQFISQSSSQDKNALKAKVIKTSFSFGHYLNKADCFGKTIYFHSQKPTQENVYLNFQLDQLHILDEV